MTKIGGISGKDVIKALEKFGFYQARQRGSHIIMRKDLPGNSIGCVVPLHKEIALGTLKSILAQAHIRISDFQKQL